MKSQDLIGWDKLMDSKKSVFFIANLLQDVAIFKNIVYLIDDELDCNIFICILPGFRQRDSDKTFDDQLKFLSANTKVQLVDITSDQNYFASLINLSPTGGLVISCSESKILDVSHSYASTLLSIAPKFGFTTITIQHGHECLGFLHNQQHSKRYGQFIGSRADYVFAWDDVGIMDNLASTSSLKIYSLGNPTRLLKTSKRNIPIYGELERVPLGTGLICENLHSIRFTSERRVEYLDDLFEFANYLGRNGMNLAIRPHPAGQYLIKNNITIPSNCFYDVASTEISVRRGYKFLISPPSTVIYDYDCMSVPCAIYQGNDETLDISNYKKFKKIQDLKDMIDFARDPQSGYQPLNEAFNELENPSSIATNYLRFFSKFLDLRQKSIIELSRHTSRAKNVLILAPDKNLPSAHICLAIPLDSINKNVFIHDERSLLNSYNADSVESSLKDCISKNSIHIVVFCRFFGKSSFLDVLETLGIPSLYFLDDQLLSPCKISIGPKKFEQHGAKERTEKIRYFLDRVDCIYASTLNLKNSLLNDGITNKILTSRINCSPVYSSKSKSHSHSPCYPPDLKKIGYMGFGHKADFDIVSSPIQVLLEEDPNLQLELIGSIQIPENLLKFKSRIKVHPPIFNYPEFLEFLRSLNWSVGLCPLARTPFNFCKSINKWIEYSSSFIPVVASQGVIYDQCIGVDAGILCDDEFASWYQSLKKIIYDKDFAEAIIKSAYFKVNTMYSQSDHGHEIASIIDHSSVNA